MTGQRHIARDISYAHSAATRGGLHEDGVADFLGDAVRIFVRFQAAIRAGHYWQTKFDSDSLGLNFVSH